MNKEEAIALVTRNGLELKNLSVEFKNDKDVVMAAVHENLTSFQYASAELQDDKEVVMSTVRVQLNTEPYSSRSMKIYQQVPLRIPIEYISNRLKGDKDVIMKAVQINGSYLRYSTVIDTDLVIEAIKTYGLAIEFAGVLKNDEGIVLTAVKQDGTALLYASPELKRNREIVMAAIMNRSYSIVYADPLFKDDLDMIMNALERSGFSAIDIYTFASPRCQMDIEVLALMYSKNGKEFLPSVPAEAWTNPKVLDWASHLPERDIPPRFRGKVNTYKDAISHAQPRATNRLTALPDSLVGKISSYLGGKSRKRNKKNKTKKR